MRVTVVQFFRRKLPVDTIPLAPTTGLWRHRPARTTGQLRSLDQLTKIVDNMFDPLHAYTICCDEF
jgi:hypothetical protein